VPPLAKLRNTIELQYMLNALLHDWLKTGCFDHKFANLSINNLL